MSIWDLDAPEHALCSEALKDYNERVRELKGYVKYHLGRANAAEAEVTRLTCELEEARAVLRVMRGERAGGGRNP